MQELSLNVPTVALLLVIAALAVLAVRRMMRRGLCDCGDHCGDGGCSGCAGCGSASASGAREGRPMSAAHDVPACCQAAQQMADAAARAVEEAGKR